MRLCGCAAVRLCGCAPDKGQPHTPRRLQLHLGTSTWWRVDEPPVGARTFGATAGCASTELRMPPIVATALSCSALPPAPRVRTACCPTRHFLRRCELAPVCRRVRGLRPPSHTSVQAPKVAPFALRCWVAQLQLQVFSLVRVCLAEGERVAATRLVLAHECASTSGLRLRATVFGCRPSRCEAAALDPRAGAPLKAA